MQRLATTDTFDDDDGDESPGSDLWFDGCIRTCLNTRFS